MGWGLQPGLLAGAGSLHKHTGNAHWARLGAPGWGRGSRPTESKEKTGCFSRPLPGWDFGVHRLGPLLSFCIILSSICICRLSSYLCVLWIWCPCPSGCVVFLHFIQSSYFLTVCFLSCHFAFQFPSPLCFTTSCISHHYAVSVLLLHCLLSLCPSDGPPSLTRVLHLCLLLSLPAGFGSALLLLCWDEM